MLWTRKAKQPPRTPRLRTPLASAGGGIGFRPRGWQDPWYVPTDGLSVLPGDPSSAAADEPVHCYDAGGAGLFVRGCHV